MNARTLHEALRRAHATQGAAPVAFATDLEHRVVGHFESLHAGRRRSPLARLALPWPALPRSVAGRTAVASFLLIGLVGMACEIPTSSPVDLGQRVVVRLASAPGPMDDEHWEAQLRSALQPLAADALRIGVGHTDEGITTVDVVAWGEDLTADTLEAAITQHVATDNVLTIEVSALSGMVSESLGRRVGRRVFGLEVEHDTAEELRAAILKQLAAEGFDGTADVQVQDDGSVRRITIEADSKDGSRQVADEIILDSGNDR